MSKDREDLSSFDYLVKYLKEAGYKVVVTIDVTGVKEGVGYKTADVSGKNIIGGFCERNEYVPYTYINGKISFDNEDLFDRWSECPYSLPLPRNEDELDYILSKMEYLGTKEGKKASNNYGIKHEDNYDLMKPKDINYIQNDPTMKIKLEKIFQYYYKEWSSKENSDKLLKAYKENIELSKLIFARGVCQGITICQNKITLENELKIIGIDNVVNNK